MSDFTFIMSGMCWDFMTENLKLATLDSFSSCLRKIFIAHMSVNSTLLQLKTKSIFKRIFYLLSSVWFGLNFKTSWQMRVS